MALADDVARVAVAPVARLVRRPEPAERRQAEDVNFVELRCRWAAPSVPAAEDEAANTVRGHKVSPLPGIRNVRFVRLQSEPHKNNIG